MKKCISIILSMAFLFSFTFSVYAMENDDRSHINSDTVTSSGRVMSLSDFNTLYGPPSLSMYANNVMSEQSAQITINNINIQKDILSFTANISVDGVSEKLSASGKLYNSYKKKDGINSIIGDLVDYNKNYEILLFEIYNDNHEEILRIDSPLADTPHLKLYLKDSEGQILLFELHIPTVLLDIEIANQEKSPLDKDAYWFAQVIPPVEEKEIFSEDGFLDDYDTSLNNQTRAVGTATDWFASSYNTITYTYAGSQVYCSSRPYGSWYAANVSGDTTWNIDFRLAEYTTIDGVRNENFPNAFTYREVTLGAGVGAKTTIIRRFLTGAVYGYGEGSNIGAYIGNTAWSALSSVAPTSAQLLSALNSCINSSTYRTVKLGDDVSSRYATGDQSFSSRISSSYEMASRDHSMHIQVVTRKSTSGSSTSNGLLYASWKTYKRDVYNGTQTKPINFSYRVS